MRNNHGNNQQGSNGERGGRPALAPCPCGEDALWYRARPTPENAPENAVCFLMDADFADNYCEACFVLAVPAADRPNWTCLSLADTTERAHGE